MQAKSIVSNRYHFTPKSSNAKVGPIPVTVTSSNSCPTSCAQYSACYAKAGFHTRLHWQKVDAGERGGSLKELCEKIAALPAGQQWRHNVSGDLPGQDERVDAFALGKIVDANAGRRGFTYTHKPVLPAAVKSSRNNAGVAAANRQAIADANARGFTVNLSADSLADADAKAELGIAPIAVVLPPDQTANTTTPAGRRVVVCPAVVRDGVTCATCKLCSWAGRQVVIGFPAHGAQAGKAKF